MSSHVKSFSQILDVKSCQVMSFSESPNSSIMVIQYEDKVLALFNMANTESKGCLDS